MTTDTIAVIVGEMRAWLKRLFCRHAGGITFVRNVYGDEILALNARSVWRCKKCGGHVYMPGLGETGDQNHD